MSETGLYSSLYQNLHEYADMIDRVLVNIKTGRVLPKSPSRQELGKLLIQLAKEQSDDLPARLIQLSLQTRSDVSSADLVNVGKALTSGEIHEDTIIRLEAIAQVLEEEQARAMSRIQRWTG
jgi:hypothetical protein